MGMWDDLVANFDPFCCPGCGTGDGEVHRPGCREGLSMGEVVDELQRAMLETGTAVVTEEMVLRDVWDAYSKRCRYGDQCTPGVDCACEDPDMREMNLRTTPARPLRVRVCPEPLGGPHWLTLLAQCAWLRGGIILGHI